MFERLAIAARLQLLGVAQGTGLVKMLVAAAMIKMIATTISNSIRENPLFLTRFMPFILWRKPFLSLASLRLRTLTTLLPLHSLCQAPSPFERLGLPRNISFFSNGLKKGQDSSADPRPLCLPGLVRSVTEIVTTKEQRENESKNEKRQRIFIRCPWFCTLPRVLTVQTVTSCSSE